ncbi:hypothetical protein BV25DRAFT_1785942, partial [Artomyces pyxidatus]
RDIFLNELVRHDGLADLSVDETVGLPFCAGCTTAHGTVRCVDCLGTALYCPECVVKDHERSPLHRVQIWNGLFFAPYSLYAAGLEIQLGHDGGSCPASQPMDSPLTVIDVTGIHLVRYNLCQCARVGASRPIVQLLRAAYFPSTVQRPRTVVTFRTLRLFHALTVQSKVNAYDFYNGLVRITDGAGLLKLKSRYKEFIYTVRFYRHIRMAKRGGRAHSPGGIEATGLGELVVKCPACPDPDMNLPMGWDTAPDSERYKYALSLAIDANFKLKLKNRKKIRDVSLTSGWSYFVEESAYQQHLALHKDEAEMKHCKSTHAAVNASQMPGDKRFAVTGVGAAICARHLFYRAHGVGDLQRGERYVNMDYVVLSTISLTAPKIRDFFLSYDISCQWSQNFWNRMDRYPGKELDPDEKTVKFVIPKFHLQAHGEPCQINYSLNYTEGVGRTCGEGIEAGWADTNGAALSTREMSASFRHEALDDFFGAINWRKIVTLGQYLLKSLRAAAPEYATQTLKQNELNATFPPEVVEKWEEMVTAWDADSSQPNPYKEPNSGSAMNNVRLELAEEEAAEASRGIASLHDMSASTFLNVGLELEEQQHVLRLRGRVKDGTPREKAARQEKSNTLRHRIQVWRSVQQTYMPALSNVQAAAEAASPSPSPPTDTTPPSPVPATRTRSRRAAKANEDNSDRPEYTTLWLPSQIPANLRSSGCTAGLIEKEIRLRVAQADDALHHIRRQLRVRLALIHHKRIHVDGPGQRAMTRAQTMLKRVNEKLQRYVAKYRRARVALETLEPGGPWEADVPELSDKDVRSPTKDEKGVGKGRRELSWIWRVQRQDSRDVPGAREATEEEVHESMRVEWAQGRARVRRWREEIQLLLEEMRRTAETLMERSAMWTRRAEQHTDVSDDIARGLRAYAHRQANIHCSLAVSFVQLWSPSVSALGYSVTW